MGGHTFHDMDVGFPCWLPETQPQDPRKRHGKLSAWPGTGGDGGATRGSESTRPLKGFHALEEVPWWCLYSSFARWGGGIGVS